MCLFLEMLWVKKGRDLSVCVCGGGGGGGGGGGLFPYYSEAPPG